MNFLAPNEILPEVYPTSAPKPGGFSRVRGPGRYLWCARKASETLGFGRGVWVKTGNEVSAKEFSGLVSRMPFFGFSVEGGEYDLLSSEDASNAKIDHFFGEYSFSETVGLWLEIGEKEASGLLSPFISTEGFTFSPEEYIDLLERLKVALRRYDRLPPVSNGLEDLNTGFFRHRNLEESSAFIRTHLAEYLRRGADLHRRFLLAINRHARSGATRRRRGLRERMARLESLADEVRAAGKLDGRPQKKAVAEIVNHWRKYLKEFFEGDNDASLNLTGIDELQAAIKEESRKVGSGFQAISRELKTDGMALNALTVDPRHGDPTELKELEVGLNELLREVDEAGLYQLPLRLTDAATTPRQLQQLDKLLDKLRNTDRHLGELPMFYDRRHFWYAQPAQLRRLLAPLLDLPSEDWETAFSSWYFERCLEREPRPERFYRQVLLNSSEQAVISRPSLPGLKKLVYLKPGAPWPTDAAAGDLLLDLSGDIEPVGNLKARICTVARLSDKTATHLAASGYRNPALVFSQSFQLLHPPRWRVHKTETPPVGPLNGVLLQLSETSDWISLHEWDGRQTEKLNIFLPRSLSSEAETSLLKHWETLILSAPVITYFHTLSPNEITQGLLSDGLNGAFLVSLLLRSAEAAELTPFDHEALIALGKELRIRCGLPDPAPHPLAVQFGEVFGKQLPAYFVAAHVPWRDTFLPLVLQSPSGKKSVLLPNGRLPGFADDATEARRHQELEAAGFTVLGVNALEVWEDLESEVQRVKGLMTAEDEG